MTAPSMTTQKEDDGTMTDGASGAVTTGDQSAPRPHEDKWQPIETAPKDLKPFLVFTPDADFSPETGIDVAWWEPSVNRFVKDGEGLEAVGATHWMPLPEPPQQPPFKDHQS